MGFTLYNLACLFLWKKATKLSKTIILEGDTSHLITLYSNYLIVPTPTETKIAQIAFAERERERENGSA